MASVIPLPRSEALSQPLRAALYGRASRDRTKRGRSVKDQFAVGEMVCAEHGWPIVDRYVDLDRSASRRAKKAREDFERMVADMEGGRMDVIVYAEKTRLSRNMQVSIALRDLCERTDIKLYYDGRLYDMRRPSDFREFTRDALQAEEEGESIASRNVRTVVLNAKRGGAHAPVAFGFKRDYDPDTGELLGQRFHPEEGPVVQELFKRVDEQHSLNSLLPLVRELRPSIQTPGLRVILKNKAYIGIRVHNDDEYKAQWDGFIDEALFWRVQGILDDPSRLTTHTSGVQHLLSGIALCSVCRSLGAVTEARLSAVGDRPQYRRKALYRCRQNHLGIMKVRLDSFVEESVFAWLASPAARAVFQQADSTAEIEQERLRHAAMQAQLLEAREQAMTFDPQSGLPGLSAASLAAMEQRVVPLLTASEEKIRRLVAVGDPLIERLMAADPERLDAVWAEDTTLEQQRYVVRKLVRVEVLRAGSTSRYLQASERVRLIFAGERGFAEWPFDPGR